MQSTLTTTDSEDETGNHMKIVATEWMSLDGVVQSPSYPTEDPSGGFRHGGWHSRFFEGVSMQWVIDSVTGADAYLLGRGTYDIFAAHWPHAGPEQAVLADSLNARRKYVASSRPLTPAWTGAHRLGKDLGASVAELKSGGDANACPLFPIALGLWSCDRKHRCSRWQSSSLISNPIIIASSQSNTCSSQPRRRRQVM
jgi:dihydrofolate reductase